jgi:hypothetical protein
MKHLHRQGRSPSSKLARSQRRGIEVLAALKSPSNAPQTDFRRKKRVNAWLRNE